MSYGYLNMLTNARLGRMGCCSPMFTPSISVANNCGTNIFGSYLTGRTDALNSFSAFGGCNTGFWNSTSFISGGIGTRLPICGFGGLGGVGIYNTGSPVLNNAYANLINTQADILRKNNSPSGKLVNAFCSNPQLMGAAANGIGTLIGGLGNGLVAAFA